MLKRDGCSEEDDNSCKYYEVSELDLSTGEYDPFYTMDYLDTDDVVNAFGMYQDNTDSEAVLYGFKRAGTDDNKLCTFTSTGHQCENVAIPNVVPKSQAHSAGAIIGNTIYFGQGEAKHAITGLGTGSLEAKADSKHVVDGRTTRRYADITGVVERAPDSFVDDGDDTADTFLLGVSTNMYLLVQKVDSAGDYGAYARLHPDVLEFVWRDGSLTQTAEDHYDHNENFYKTEENKDTYKAPGWGAAFTFDGDVPRVFFANNAGWGVFELKNVVVPAACFRTESGGSDCGDEDGDGGKGSAALQWVANSDPTSKNDGMNCPNAFVDL